MGRHISSQRLEFACPFATVPRKQGLACPNQIYPSSAEQTNGGALWPMSRIKSQCQENSFAGRLAEIENVSLCKSLSLILHAHPSISTGLPSGYHTSAKCYSACRRSSAICCSNSATRRFSRANRRSDSTRSLSSASATRRSASMRSSATRRSASS